MLYRIRVNWTGFSVQGGGLSTFYFDEVGGTANQAATAVAVFLGAIDNNLTTTLAWTMETDVALINAVGGGVEGFTTVAPASGGGSNTAEVLPLASQGLIRLRTGFVTNRRELRGKLFIPGFCENNQSLGKPDDGTLLNINTALDALVASANAEYMVYSRTHNIARPVSSARMWTKWAVLRSRRD